MAKSCQLCGFATQDSEECRLSGLCLHCLLGPPPPQSYDDYECCASGSCEVCRGTQGLVRMAQKAGERDA